MNSNNTFLSIENEKHCIGYKIMSNNLVCSCNCERLAINGKPNMTGLLLGQQILIVQTILPSTFPTISRRKQKIFSYGNNNNGRSPVNNRTKTLYYRTKCSTIILPVSKLVALSNDTLLFYIKLQILSQN